MAIWFRSRAQQYSRRRRWRQACCCADEKSNRIVNRCRRFGLGTGRLIEQGSDGFNTPLLAQFLQTFHDSGCPKISPGTGDLTAQLEHAGQSVDERGKVDRILGEWHAAAALDFPGPALSFHPEASFWGALLLFRAVSLVCFRDVGPAEIQRLLGNQMMPDGTNPAAHFSADLCLRHWPAVYRMARSRSEDDVLVKTMEKLAANFPLSSLGMKIPVIAGDPLFEHRGFHQFFAERALERADPEALGAPDIFNLIRLKLGKHAATLGRGFVFPAIES